MPEPIEPDAEVEPERPFKFTVTYTGRTTQLVALQEWAGDYDSKLLAYGTTGRLKLTLTDKLLPLHEVLVLINNLDEVARGQGLITKP